MLTLIDPLVPRGPNAPPSAFLLTHPEPALAVTAPDASAPPEETRAFLTWLAARGVVIRRRKTELRAKPCTPDALTPAIRTLLVARREEILVALTTHACAKCGRFAFPRPETLCYWCHS